MADEKRAHPRAPGVIEGTWSGGRGGCRITSLSVSGCYIECLVPPEKGEHVRVKLNLPEDHSVTLTAEVVTSDKVGRGFSMRFVDPPLEDLEKLAGAVDWLFKRQESEKNSL